MRKCYINGILNTLKAFPIFNTLKSVHYFLPLFKYEGFYHAHHMTGLSNKDLKNSESTDLYCYNKLVNKFNLLNKLFPFSHAIIKEKSPMIRHQNANEPALPNCWPEGTQLRFEASVKKAQYHEHWLPSLLLPQFLHATSLFRQSWCIIISYPPSCLLP